MFPISRGTIDFWITSERFLFRSRDQLNSNTGTTLQGCLDGGRRKKNCSDVFWRQWCSTTAALYAYISTLAAFGSKLTVLNAHPAALLRYPKHSSDNMHCFTDS
jgi:hypothetical protein